MRKVLAVAVLAASLTVMGFGATAPGVTPGPEAVTTINISEGVVGTTVTITGGDCGQIITPLRASGVGPAYVSDTAWLVVTVAGWPAPFDTGVHGEANDVNGFVTVTLTVPNVAPGPYTIAATCFQLGGGGLHAGISADARPFAFGDYPNTLTFTVLAPAAPVPVVEALATTTG